MLFSLYNTKINAFKGIFEAENEDVARKMFIELLNSPQPNEVTQYIDEFILYCIGNFDKSTGKLDVCDAPISVMNGLECIQAWKERKRILEDIYGKSNIQNPPAEQKVDVSLDIPDFMKGDEENGRTKTDTNDNIVSIR